MPPGTVITLHYFFTCESVLLVESKGRFVPGFNHQPPRFHSQRAQFRERVVEHGLADAMTPVARMHGNRCQLRVSGTGAGDNVAGDVAANRGDKKQVRTLAVERQKQFLIPGIVSK
jgi:hypothetical protein